MSSDILFNLRDSFRTRKYIPSKYMNNQSMKICIIVTFVVFILIIAVIVGVFYWNKDINPGKSMHLILSGNDKYAIFNVTSKNISEWYSFNDSSVGSYEFYGIHNFFWYSINKSTISRSLFPDILSNSSSNGLHGPLFDEPRVIVQDMAYDHIGENLYIIDKSIGILIVIDVRTEFYDILLVDLIRPHHIQVDSQEGLMFILEQSHSILRGNMDGSSLENIFKSDFVTALMIDTINKRIYYADYSKGIESSDYEGKNRRIFSIDILNIVDLAVVNDEIYWLWNKYDDEKPIHYLLSCKIIKGNCDDHLSPIELNNLGELASMKIIQELPKWNQTIKNLCSKEISECHHLCLLSSFGNPSCACKIGWHLDLNKKSCRQDKEFMLYNFGKYFRGRILDSDRNYSVDTILPTPYETDYKHKMSFDYDMVNDILYFSDHKNINTMKLRSNWTGQSVLLQGDENIHIIDVALDFVTGNLYYLENKHTDGYKIHVLNVKLGSQYNKTLISEEFFFCSSMLFHSSFSQLLIFLTVKIHEFYNLTIKIATANGTEEYQISHISLFPMLTTPFSINYSDGRIYWVSILDRKLMSAFINGTDIKKNNLEAFFFYKGINVYRKWIYANTDYVIYRTDIENGTNKIKLAPILNDYSKDKINSVKIFSESMMSSKENLKNSCSKRNGGCDQFCFRYYDKAICDCRTGEILNSQNHCIIEKS